MHPYCVWEHKDANYHGDVSISIKQPAQTNNAPAVHVVELTAIVTTFLGRSNNRSSSVYIICIFI